MKNTPRAVRAALRWLTGGARLLRDRNLIADENIRPESEPKEALLRLVLLCKIMPPSA